MAGNTANTHAYQDAPDLYSAATGTTFPATLAAAWTGFTAVGLLGEDGLTEARDQDSSDHYAWGGILLRTIRSKHKRTFQVVLLEDNATVFGLINPGSTTATATGVDTRTVKVPVGNIKAFGFDLKDGGAAVKRILIPTGEITDVGDVVYSDGDVTGWEATITVYPAADGTLYKEIIATPA